MRTIVTRHLNSNDYPKRLFNKVKNRANPTTQQSATMGVGKNERESQQNDNSLDSIEGQTQQISRTLAKEIPGIKIAYKHKKKNSKHTTIDGQRQNTRHG